MQTETKRIFIPVKDDMLFRLLFADERNEEHLIAFLQAVLNLPKEEYAEVSISDPHLLREYDGDKMGIIDVKLCSKNGKIIHIEIQLKLHQNMRQRVIFYDAKLITEQLGSGDDYEKINKVISIIIMDENLISNSPNYHHKFTFYDPSVNVEFSDLIEIHTLELRKLPTDTDGTQLYDWARFIAAESEEEINMVAEKNPQIMKTVVKYRELTADERVRDRIERQEKARRDQAAFLKQALQQGIEQGEARNNKKNAFMMLKEGLAFELVKRITGLSDEELTQLSEIN